MKKVFKKISIFFLFILSKAIWLVRKKEFTAVLMYHLTPSGFESQIKYLKDKGFHFLNLNQFESFLCKGNVNSKKNILITFDDGYKDFLLKALPVLKRHSAPAVIFTHTNRINKNLDNVFELMNWQEIKYSAKDGVEIAGHSHTHSDMSKLTKEEIISELINSESAFKINGIKFNTGAICYPGGRFKDSTIDVLKSKGYKMAFTSKNGLVYRGDDPFKIKRVAMDESMNFYDFKINLTPAMAWYKNIKRLFI